MTARQIFDEIVFSAWNMGEPGCVFLDTVNECNPLPGLGTPLSTLTVALTAALTYLCYCRRTH